MTTKTKRAPYTRKQRAVIGLILLAAISLLFVAALSPDNSLRQARFGLASNAVFMIFITAMSIVDARSGRRIDPLWLLSSFIFALGLGYQVGKHPDLASHWVLTAVAVVFFVSPLPFLAVLTQQQRDEFQRSVLAQSALVSLTAFLVGGLGYAVLARVDHLPDPSLLVVIPALGGLWLVTHVVLWLMRS